MTSYDKSSTSGSAATPGKQAEATGGGWRLQLKKSIAGSGFEAGKAALQFKGNGTSDVGAATAGFKGASAPVPYQGRVESAIGADLSGVQAHTGPEAQAACKSLGAEAYTYGNRIAFATPTPSPDLVAHEATHTVQQGAAPTTQKRLSTAGGAASANMEAEADAAAKKV